MPFFSNWFLQTSIVYNLCSGALLSLGANGSLCEACSSLGRCLYEVLSLKDQEFHRGTITDPNIGISWCPGAKAENVQDRCQSEIGSAVPVTHKSNERDWGRYNRVGPACFGLATIWHREADSRQETNTCTCRSWNFSISKRCTWFNWY